MKDVPERVKQAWRDTLSEEWMYKLLEKAEKGDTTPICCQHCPYTNCHVHGEDAWNFPWTLHCSRYEAYVDGMPTVMDAEEACKWSPDTQVHSTINKLSEILDRVVENTPSHILSNDDCSVLDDGMRYLKHYNEICDIVDRWNCDESTMRTDAELFRIIRKTFKEHKDE